MRERRLVICERCGCKYEPFNGVNGIVYECKECGAAVNDPGGCPKCNREKHFLCQLCKDS